MRVFRAGVGATAALLLVAVSVRATGGSPDGRQVRYEGDRLTVRLKGVPLDQVLDDLARQAGAEIRGTVKDPREVSVEFDAVPLPDALARLLGDQNFALVYGEGGQLRAVRLLGGPQDPGALTGGSATAPGQATAAAAPAKSYDAVGTLTGLVTNHPPIAVSGRLAEALGSTSVSFRQLLEATLRHDDAVVRAEAIRQSLRVLEAEPTMQTATIEALKGMGDADIGTLLRGMAGDHAEEILLHVGAQARASEIRVKAAAALRELRAQARERPAG